MSDFPHGMYRELLEADNQERLLGQWERLRVAVKFAEMKTRMIEHDEVDLGYKLLSDYRNEIDAIKRLLFGHDGERQPLGFIKIPGAYVQHRVIFCEDDELLYRLTWDGRNEP